MREGSNASDYQLPFPEQIQVETPNQRASKASMGRDKGAERETESNASE